jgi:hypothetical protein
MHAKKTAKMTMRARKGRPDNLTVTGSYTSPLPGNGQVRLEALAESVGSGAVGEYQRPVCRALGNSCCERFLAALSRPA